MKLKLIVLVFLAALVLLLFSGCPEPEEDNGAGGILPTPAGISPTPGGPAAPLESPSLPKSEWTLMVYLDADNDLEQASVMDVDEMEKIGSTESVKVLVQWDRIEGFDQSNGDWTGTKRFLVKKDEEEGKIASEELADLGELNMAEAGTLAEFIEWGMQNYPAEKYALFLWDHGGGWTMHTEDKTSKSHSDLDSLRDAFSKAGLEKEKLDLLVFDQCLMGQVDVAYAVAPYAKVMVASEDVVPFFGGDYSAILTELNKEPGFDEKELAIKTVEAFENFYSEKIPNPFTTMTAIDLEKIGGVKTSLDAFANALEKNVEEDWQEIGESLYFSESFATPEGLAVVKTFNIYDLVDFSDIVRQKIASQEIEETALALKEAVREAVISDYYGSEHPYANGLTVYFPEDETLYIENYSQTPFAKETGWNDFITEYIRAEKTDVIQPAMKITSVSPTTTNIDSPVNIKGTATGNNLVSLFRVVGRVHGDTIYMLSSHPLIQVYREYEGDRKLPEFVDGENSIDYTWVPTATYITNGKEQIIAPIQPFGKGDYFFAVQGEYSGREETFDAVLVFDYRTGSLLNALRIIETQDTAAQKEFLVREGDIFTPYMEYYDMQAREYSLMKSDSIAVSENGLGLDIFLLPDGQYVVGIFVSDLLGNTVTDIATVNVAGQPEENPGISVHNVTGNWIGEQISFEIREDGTCISKTASSQNECTYWFRNNGLPLISFYIQADELVFAVFMVEATENRLTLTEMFEGQKYVMWRNGIEKEEEEIDAALTGKWFSSTGSIEFLENRSYVWEINGKTIAGTFSTENGKLYLNSEGKETEYSYNISGETLSLTDSQGSTLSFSKSSGQQNPVAGTWYNSMVDETVYFNADSTYQSYMSGVLFVSGTYAVKGSTLTLSSVYGTFNYTFTVTESTLFLYDPLYGTTTQYIKLETA